jgi:predicted PurR-regulated permease PerM
MVFAWGPFTDMNSIEALAERRAEAHSEENERRAYSATRWTVLLLCLAAALTILPLWQPLLLAAFVAIVAEPLYLRVYRKVEGRSSAAALLTLLLAVFALVPIVIATLSIYEGAIDLLRRLQQSSGGSEALKQLAARDSGNGGLSFDWNGQKVVELVRQQGWGALSTARTIFGAATTAVVGAFIFAVGFYTFLVQGRRVYAWLLKRSPLPRAYGVRFGDAFVETGRGLLVGVGLTALVQGAVATIAYFAIGISQAAVLGLMTALAALVPSLGTGLVWVPVVVGLFLTGRTQAAVALLIVGGVVSVLDNLIRPWLSKYGKLDLSTFLLLIAMLGGVAAFGGFGLLLGPLLVRLAVEGLRLLHDEQLDAPQQNGGEGMRRGAVEEEGGIGVASKLARAQRTQVSTVRT